MDPAQAQAQAIQVLVAASQGVQVPAQQAQDAIGVLGQPARQGDPAAIAALVPPAVAGDPAAQAAVNYGVAFHAAQAESGNPAAIGAIAPPAASGNPAAIAALAPVVVANVDGAIGGNHVSINAVVPAVNALAVAASGGNQAALAALTPANNAVNGAAAALAANIAGQPVAGQPVAGQPARSIGLLSVLASGSAAAAAAIGSAFTGNVRNIVRTVLPAGRLVPAFAPLPQGPGRQANALQALPALPQGQVVVPAAQAGALAVNAPIPNVQQPPQAAVAPTTAPPVRANQGQFRMRGHFNRGPTLDARATIVGQLAQNLIVTPEIITEAINGEMEFLAAYNITPGYPGYEVILTELVILKLQIILGGVFLTLNSAHFLDRAQVATEIEANDFRRRLTILESQAHGLIASAGVYADQLRLNMILKFRRESLTEQLIATELSSAHERIKYGLHGQIINDYGPFMSRMRVAIDTMNASAGIERAAVAAAVANGRIANANAARGAARIAERDAGTQFLEVEYPNLLRMMPVNLHNQVIKIKLRQIEAAACLFAYYLISGNVYIDREYLERVLAVFMTSDNRLTQLGINRFRVDFAPPLGLNPYAYLFDRTVIDMGRFMFRFGNNTRLGALTLLSQLVHSHPTSQALNPQFIHQMMVAIEEQLGAINSAPGTLVLSDTFTRGPDGSITGISLGGAGFKGDLSLTDVDIDSYIRAIVGNMVNNGTSAGDKTILEQYFRGLFHLCIAGNPANLPCIPGGADVEIPNPYYDIERIYQRAVATAQTHAETTDWKNTTIAALMDQGAGNTKSLSSAKSAWTNTLIEREREPERMAQEQKRMAQIREKGAEKKEAALSEQSTVATSNFTHTTKSRNNRNQKRRSNSRQYALSFRRAQPAAPAPITAFGGSRKRRVKRTKKNRKRTRRQ